MIRRTFKHFAQGLLMGGADIIPGVSGGTMALIVGIYTRLIASISHGFTAVIALIRLDAEDARRHFGAVTWELVLPLAAGIGVALVLGARIIPHLLERYPMQCLGLFFGLVAASLYIPWQRIGRKGPPELGMAVVMAVVAFLLTGIAPAQYVEPSLLTVFGCAAVAICAMILPGVSGAFLLKVLGIYEATLLAVNSRETAYILVFMAGAVVGLGFFSKLLNFLLNRFHDLTMAALVGLMAGALRALWPWQGAGRELELPGAADPVASVVALAAAGFLFVLTLAWWSDRLEEHAAAERAAHGAD